MTAFSSQKSEDVRKPKPRRDGRLSISETLLARLKGLAAARGIFLWELVEHKLEELLK